MSPRQRAFVVCLLSRALDDGVLDFTASPVAEQKIEPEPNDCIDNSDDRQKGAVKAHVWFPPHGTILIQRQTAVSVQTERHISV